MIKVVVMVLLLSAAVILGALFDVTSWLDQLWQWRANAPWRAAGLFFAVYVTVAALSIPGAAIMTLVGGALFGFLQGLALVSFASSVGALLAFLIARWLFRESLRQRYQEKYRQLEINFNRRGGAYLVSLRLVPVVPFFLVNLLFALLPIKPWRFYWLSQVAMLPGTMAYVYAGVGVASIDELSLAGILTPSLMGALCVLALLPHISGWVGTYLERRLLAKKFNRPKQFDYNLVAIGAGAGGLVSSYIGAATNAKVALIEKADMGGDCLNRGCVPSKSLLASAKQAKDLRKNGLAAPAAFERAKANWAKAIATIAPNDSVARYSDLGVSCYQGRGRLLSPWLVEITEAGQKRVISAKSVVLATGSRPALPAISGLDKVNYLNSDTIWQLQQLPERLVVIGAGAIACELGQAFARLGSQVTMLARSTVLSGEDRDIAEKVVESLKGDAIDIIERADIDRVDTQTVILTDGRELPFDQLLVAVGRQANTEDLGLEEIDVALGARGELLVDGARKTNIDSILGCGDVTGQNQFTHLAGHGAWYASVNALFGTFKTFREARPIRPKVIFTGTQLARVGLSETEAKAQGVAYELTEMDLSEVDRFIIEQQTGRLKILTRPGSDQILGVAIASEVAEHLIGEFITAMTHGLGLKKILATIHCYPSYQDANKLAAGKWQQAHKPEKIIMWLEKFHAWRRG